MRLLTLVLFILLAALQSCGDHKVDQLVNAVFPDERFKNDPQFYFQEARAAQINVFYFDESVPFTGFSEKVKIDYWDITKENLKTIFQYKSFETDLIVPNELSEMKNLGKTDQRNWTFENMKSLAYEMALIDTNIVANFNIFFVPGYFIKSGEKQEQVIGLNIAESNIIFIFHDIIESSSSLALKVFMEQSTLVHELGHVLGFVNNGVPLSSNHQDIENGKHTIDPTCVMYHSNEGLSNMEAFAKKYMETKNLSMWGDQTLRDAEDFSR